MENKLTAAIAATYWGAKFNYKMPDCDFFANDITMTCIQPTLFFGVDEEGKINHYPIKDCKLILKPLSEISDEDAIEVAKICQILREPATEMNIYLGRGVVLWHLCEITPWGGSKYEHLDNVKTRDIITNVQPIYFVEIINFLRKKSYDCDNLIALTIAITKLK